MLGKHMVVVRLVSIYEHGLTLALKFGNYQKLLYKITTMQNQVDLQVEIAKNKTFVATLNIEGRCFLGVLHDVNKTKLCIKNYKHTQ